MKEIDTNKLNKSSDSIWMLINESVKSKNWAVLTQNLTRLHALQDHYCKLLNIQKWELEMLRNEERYLNKKVNEFEKRELEQITKQNGTYQTFKSQIDELFEER